MDGNDKNDDKIDESSEESFPASDAPAWTPLTGEHVDLDGDAATADPPITHDAAKERFELRWPDGIAFLSYHRMRDGRMMIRHTEVPPVFQGSGVGGRLVRAAMDFAREQRLPVVLGCPFAKAYVEKHPELEI